MPAGQPATPRGQVVSCLDGAPARGFTGGKQLTGGSIGEPAGADGGEHVMGGPQLITRIDSPVVAAQPFTINEMAAASSAPTWLQPELIKPAVDDEGDAGVESSAWFQQGSDAASVLIRPGYE